MSKISPLPQDWTNFDWVVSSAMLEHLPKAKVGVALKNLQKKVH